MISFLALNSALQFFVSGGLVMYPLLLCSITALTVAIYKAMTLREEIIAPKEVIRQLYALESYAVRGELEKLQNILKESDSLLGRTGLQAVSASYASKDEAIEAIQINAREEMHRMEWGLNALEMIITIAPLLGLLGTVAGLVDVFAAVNPNQGGDVGDIAAGISIALNTTIAGLAIAVPSVVAHSYFSRKLESIAVKMEGALTRTVATFFRLYDVSSVHVGTLEHNKKENEL